MSDTYRSLISILYIESKHFEWLQSQIVIKKEIDLRRYYICFLLSEPFYLFPNITFKPKTNLE